MRAGVRSGGTFINVVAPLTVVRRNDESLVTGTNVATIGQVHAVLFAAAHRQVRARVRVMAAKFVGSISAVVCVIAHLTAIDALLVGALVLRVDIARFNPGSAQCHIVFVRAIAAIVYAITYLIASHASMVGTLESA